jgi:hypothetical protein
VLKLATVVAKIVLHPDCSVEGALGMILVSNRGAEQGEDTIARRLHNVAAVVPHGSNHEPERGVDNFSRFFRVEVLHQFHRSLDVSEERSHRLAFTIDYVRVGLLGQEANPGLWE